MNTMTEPLRDRTQLLWVEDTRGRTAVSVLVFALLAAFSAQIAVHLPLTPVPVTFQPLIVVLAGVLLGPRAGALSMTAYVIVGAMGAPIFSFGGAGLPWLLGPTGGYLLAAPAAAFVAGLVSGRGDVAWRLFLGLTLGVSTMYAGGVAQLMMTSQGLGAAMALGVIPFVVGDVMKVLFGFFAVFGVRKTLSQNA
jgi:biotin transport system substrate-specific component